MTGLAYEIVLDVQVRQENRKIIICQEIYGDDMMKTEKIHFSLRASYMTWH